MPPDPGHPEGLPHLFLDRSLGRIQVPQRLRAAGLLLTTLSEHYGMPADEQVADVTWLTDSGQHGWVVFMKDERIRRRPAEQAAVIAHRVRCFVIVRGDLRAAEMANRFLDNLPAIVHACREPGPFLYAVHERRIEELKLD